MEKLLEIIKNKIETPIGCQCDLKKIYRVIVMKNGKKQVIYDFETEEEAMQCYALICNPNICNDEYIENQETFLTIYYEPLIWC